MAIDFQNLSEIGQAQELQRLFISSVNTSDLEKFHKELLENQNSISTLESKKSELEQAISEQRKIKDAAQFDSEDSIDSRAKKVSNAQVRLDILSVDLGAVESKIASIPATIEELHRKIAIAQQKLGNQKNLEKALILFNNFRKEEERYISAKKEFCQAIHDFGLDGVFPGMGRPTNKLIFNPESQTFQLEIVNFNYVDRPVGNPS